METIVQPKKNRYDLTCSNVVCAAVLRCEVQDLAYHERQGLSDYQVGFSSSLFSAAPSRSWAFKCPHCESITIVTDLIKHVVSE